MRQLAMLTAVFALALTMSTRELNGGGWAIYAPIANAEILKNATVLADGGCPMGESVIAEMCLGSDPYATQTIMVFEEQDTWGADLTPPYYGWNPMGTGWSIKVRDDAFGLRIIRSVVVIDFGA